MKKKIMKKIPYDNQKKLSQFLTDVIHTDEKELSSFCSYMIEERDAYVENAINDFCKKNDYLVEDFRERVISAKSDLTGADVKVTCEDLLKGFYNELLRLKLESDQADRERPLVWTFEITADSKAIHEEMAKIESEEDKK